MTVHRATIPPIVLTTDFGLSDAYVGVMKGVILGINPSASIIDLTHDIQPQNVLQGGFVLGTNFPYFPAGAVHLAVVDPGVGTLRRAVALETPVATFVAPDNGLLSEVIKGHLDGASPSAPSSNQETVRIELPESLMAYSLESPRFRLEPVSRTFHGRDIFAPAAAHISLGVSPAEMGPRVHDLVYHPLPEPAIVGGAVVGNVIYIDRFGNLVTNVNQDNAVAAGYGPGQGRVQIGDRTIDRLSLTFHDLEHCPSLQPDGLPLVALFGSSGHLEIAVRDGSAAQSLAVGVGAVVRLTLNP